MTLVTPFSGGARSAQPEEGRSQPEQESGQEGQGQAQVMRGAALKWKRRCFEDSVWSPLGIDPPCLICSYDTLNPAAPPAHPTLLKVLKYGFSNAVVRGSTSSKDNGTRDLIAVVRSYTRVWLEAVGARFDPGTGADVATVQCLYQPLKPSSDRRDRPL